MGPDPLWLGPGKLSFSRYTISTESIIIHGQTLPSIITYPEPLDPEKIWYKDLVRDVSICNYLPLYLPFSYFKQFRVMNQNELPAGSVSGVVFTTVSLNPLIYLPWLKEELESRGVTFIRKKVHSIEEAAQIAGPTGVVINATALGATS